MKILQVIPYFWPAIQFGGPVKVVYEICEELAKKHSITVYTSDAYDERSRMSKKKRIERKRNFKVYYFKNLFNAFTFRFRLYTNFGIVFEYVKRRDEFDRIHFHDVFSLPQVFLSLLARIYRKPYIISTHGVDIAGKRQKALVKTIMYKVFIKKMLMDAKVIMATSKEEAGLLHNLGFRNIKIIYNGVSQKKVKPSHKFDRFEEKNALTLLYIGRINKLKGLAELIEAIGIVDFPIQLLIAGPDDGGKENLIRKIKRKNLTTRIHFLGLVDESEKSELYELSDLFVYTSKLEGFSISILEAMANSLPVLITEACNFPDVKKFKAGIVLSNEEIVNAISESLKYLYQNDAVRRKMAKNAKVLVKQKYSIQKMASNVERIYEKFV